MKDELLLKEVVVAKRLKSVRMITFLSILYLIVNNFGHLQSLGSVIRKDKNLSGIYQRKISHSLSLSVNGSLTTIFNEYFFTKLQTKLELF